MFRPRSEASDYFAVCSFRFGAAPAALAGLAALLNGGIWLMDLKCSSCLFLQMCSLVGFSAQKPASKTWLHRVWAAQRGPKRDWPRPAAPRRRPGHSLAR